MTSKKVAKATLQQLKELPNEGGSLKIGSDHIEVTHLDKPFWPKTRESRGYTKRELLAYYTNVSPYLLPHLKDRPVTVVRYPHGVTGLSFFQKHPQSEVPKFVKTFDMFSGDKESDFPFFLVENLQTILWFVQLGIVDFHPWYSRMNTSAPDAAKKPTKFTSSKENVRKSILNYPDFMVFDLDPYIYSGKEKAHAEPERNKKSFEATREVAFKVYDVMKQLQLTPFVKLSGKTGIHIYTPIKRDVTYEETREMAREIGNFILQSDPKKITMEWSVPKRRGKIFFDFNQNSLGKTLASIYSVRAYKDATVSMPVSWKQLETVSPKDFTMANVPNILEKSGDAWADILTKKKDLRKLLSKKQK